MDPDRRRRRRRHYTFPWASSVVAQLFIRTLITGLAMAFINIGWRAARRRVPQRGIIAALICWCLHL
jgi:hypothetical protein